MLIECIRAPSSSLWLNDPIKDQVARSVPLRVETSVTFPWRIDDATFSVVLLKRLEIMTLTTGYYERISRRRESQQKAEVISTPEHCDSA
jgi:hypothetical protein